MHRIFKSSNVDQCIAAIKKFIQYANENGRTTKQAMSDLIAYVFKRPLPNSLLHHNDDPKVASLKRLCLRMDSRVHMGMLLGVPEICIQLGNYNESMAGILSQDDAALDLISKFYYLLRNEPLHRMQFIMNDAWDNIHSKQSETAFLYCMQTFAPALIIEDCIPKDAFKIDLLNKILEALQCKTTICYRKNAVSSKEPHAMELFLKSMNVTSRLSLTHGSFDDWTVADMQSFVRMVKSCPHLTHLNLSHMNIQSCALDEGKFKCILELIGLPQLQDLNLSGNRLNRIEGKPLELLERAISSSPIGIIRQQTSSEKIVPGNSLYVSSDNAVSEPENDREESLYMRVL